MGANGIYGLSGSGLDIDSMVKVGMLKKQNTYDKMYQEETKNTWIKNAYTDVYAELNTFKDAMSTFNKQSAMSAMTATTSNANTVTAKANGAAAAMTHKVQVENLASNAYLLTKDSITRASGANASYNLKDVAFVTINNAIDSEGKQCYNICRSAQDIEAIVDKTISYGDTEYKNAKVNGDGKIELYNEDGTIGATVTKAAFLSDATVKDGNGDKLNYLNIDDDGKISCGKYEMVQKDAAAISFKISDGTNEAEIRYTYEDLIVNNKTLYDLATDISGSGVNISAKYDASTDAFSLYNTNGGSENKISITAGNDNTAGLFNNLGMGSTDGTVLSDALKFEKNVANGAEGKDGKVIIDGKSYSNLTGNSLSVAGVTYTFNNLTEGQAATISVSQDTDSIIDNVKSFVDAYNTLLDSLQKKYGETAYPDYKPLTKNQEANMTETQIKQWNEKAKSGLLYHSSTLRDVISNLREALATPVDKINSKYNSAAAIGITTTNVKGHVTLDEDKLKEALAADPDCVYQIFGSLEYEKDALGNETKNIDTRNTGIANRFYFDTATNAMNKIKDYAGTTAEVDDNSYMGKLITNMLKRMTSFKTQMDAYEKLLYKRYDKMETALSKLGTQMSYITGER